MSKELVDKMISDLEHEEEFFEYVKELGKRIEKLEKRVQELETYDSNPMFTAGL